MPKKEWNEKVDGRRGIDETDPVILCQNSCKSVGKMPCLAVLSIDYNLTCIDIQESPLAILVAEHCERIPFRNA